ncbi:MAG: DNA repair protein RecO, partial [Bdellovibrionota bacterium]
MRFRYTYPIDTQSDSIRDLAVVLRVVPYEERHQMVTALTRHHGRVTAIALNSVQSRRFGGTLQPFAASEWMWKPQGRNPQAEVIRLDEALSRRSYDGIRRDYARLTGASALVELFIKAAPEREPCEELFLLLTHALAAIEESPSIGLDFGIQAIVNGVVARLLRWAGVRPATETCRGGCGLGCQDLGDSTVVATSIADA